MTTDVSQPMPESQQAETESPRSEERGYQGKLLKILIYESGDGEPKVSVALPLRLARWAANLLPQLAKFGPLVLDLAAARHAQSGESTGFVHAMSQKYGDSDVMEFLTSSVRSITEMIDEGFDELEQIGPFDFVTIQDEGDKIRICIE